MGVNTGLVRDDSKPVGSKESSVCVTSLSLEDFILLYSGKQADELLDEGDHRRLWASATIVGPLMRRLSRRSFRTNLHVF